MMQRSFSDCELVYIRHTPTTVSRLNFTCHPLTVLLCVCLEKTAHASTPCRTLYVHCLLLTRRTHSHYYCSYYCCTTAIAMSLLLLPLLTVHTSACCSRLHLYNHTAAAAVAISTANMFHYCTHTTAGHCHHQTDSQTGRAPRACCGSAHRQYRTALYVAGSDRRPQCHASRCGPTALERSYQPALNSTSAKQHEYIVWCVSMAVLPSAVCKAVVVATMKYAFLMESTSYNLRNVRYATMPKLTLLHYAQHNFQLLMLLL
jgi:hypothetical protein